MKNCILLFAILLTFQLSFSQETTYRNLVFEGAGMRGLAYAGAINQLAQYGVLENIEKVGGTSAGAIISLALALDYTPDDIEEIISTTNFSKFNDHGFFFFTGFSRINRKFGYYKGDKFLKWVEKLIKNKTGNPDITFNELHKQGYRDLYVVATSLNNQKLITFSKDTYPNMPIKNAVRASMSIPLYFKAVYVDKEGNLYDKPQSNEKMDLMVDGGIAGNYPIHIFDSTYQKGDVTIRIPNEATLGIRIDSDDQIAQDMSDHELAPMRVKNVKDYVTALYVYVVENLNRSDLSEDDWKRTIMISDAGVGPKIKKLKDSQKDALFQSGKTGVNSFFQQWASAE